MSIQKLQSIRNVMRMFMLSSAMLVALGTGSAFARVSIGGGNDTTGPFSDNQNRWCIESDSNIDIHNSVDVDNDNDFEVQTGLNETRNNTIVDDMSTGDITGDIEVTNELNSGDIQLSDEDMSIGDIEVDFSNELTGPNSRNENELNVDADVDVDIENRADIDNDFSAHLNTGYNEVENNTEVGDFRTGDIDFSVETNNTANQAGDGMDLSGLSGINVSGDFTNSITGPNSENSNELNLDVDQDINITNHADIDNNTEITANTGHNDIGCNTVVGDVSTGSVTIHSTTSNVAN